jgi:hypothetical protein
MCKEKQEREKLREIICTSLTPSCPEYGVVITSTPPSSSTRAPFLPPRWIANFACTADRAPHWFILRAQSTRFSTLVLCNAVRSAGSAATTPCHIPATRFVNACVCTERSWVWMYYGRTEYCRPRPLFKFSICMEYIRSIQAKYQSQSPIQRRTVISLSQRKICTVLTCAHDGDE